MSQRGDKRVINVAHDLDICSSGSLASAIRLAAAMTPHVVVSLEDCAYCDAKGLSVLLGAKAALGTRLSIVVPPGRPIHRIFEITKVGGTLSLCNDLAEAIGSRVEGGAVDIF